MKKTYAWFMLLALVLPLVLSGCGTAATEAPTEPPAAAPTEAPVVEPTEAPMPMVDPSGQTVTFWHVWGTGTTGEGLLALVDEFNATNEWGITVEALDQGAYNDLEDAMNAAIQSGDLPNIVVGYTNALDTWHSVGVMADLDALINDPDYGLTADEVADYYAGAWNNGISANGQRVGFPHGQSENVIFYNNSWAEDLGFANPPATLDEFKSQVCAAAEANNSDSNPDNDGTGGLVLYTGASNVASFVYGLGDNLRNDAGDGYDFTKPAVVRVAEFWKDLWDEGCAFPTESYPNPEFASRRALMTMSSTAGYTYQVSAFEAEGAMTDDAWTFIPFVGDSGTQAVDAYIQNSAIVKSSPEKELASWLFLKWFTSPEINARWIEVSAYYPIRMSAVDLLGDYSAANPLWAQGLELAPYGMSEPGWASWSTVRRDVQDTFATILQSDKSEIPALLDDLNAKAAEALAETQ
jgi:multiple sugar transport system substrate-binding protein